MYDAGLFAMLAPKAYGGLELTAGKSDAVQGAQRPQSVILKNGS
jgi:alkylation response protein AidB-like acyl-CoA dehydrogenase